MVGHRRVVPENGGQPILAALEILKAVFVALRCLGSTRVAGGCSLLVPDGRLPLIFGDSLSGHVTNREIVLRFGIAPLCRLRALRATVWVSSAFTPMPFACT